VLTNLFFILIGRVYDDFGDEGEKDVFEKLGGHLE